MSKKFTLGKSARLKSRKLIGRVFAEGESFNLAPFRVCYLCEVRPGESLLQAGFSVPARNFKRAVDRNRIRRMMKEAYRLQKHSLENVLKMANRPLSVFVIYTGNDIPPYERVSQKMQAVIEKLMEKA